MKDIIDFFKEITAIPRCSKTYSPFIEYVKQISTTYNYTILIDDVNNILCKKLDSKATLCLQSHYDIVCLSDNALPQIIEKDGFLFARNSTLGADNGIGCAYMLALMSQGYDCEYLFTSDEEIGLIGANGINLEIKAKNMLNLDSEEEGGVCIGCAGGVDFFASSYKSTIVKNTDNLDLYEISINKLPGGHSGVNIDDNIPNALKLLCKSIKEANGKLLDLNAGERINSIPANAKAIIASKTKPLKTHEHMIITKIQAKSENLNIYSDEIVDYIYTFAQGVRAYDKNLNVVLTSINLALAKTTHDSIELQLSARSMQNDLLQDLRLETSCSLKNYGFEVKTSGKYPAWKPDVNSFTNQVLEVYKEYDKNASLKAIHAGLECAIFKDKYPLINVASIGPNIFNPHSHSERVEIDSVYKVFEVVKKIVEKI